jgi:hypothetical protein
MSTTDNDTETPDPRDNPKAVIHEELGDHRDAIEALADLDLGVLSEDAEKALEILEGDHNER